MFNGKTHLYLTACFFPLKPWHPSASFETSSRPKHGETCDGGGDRRRRRLRRHGKKVAVLGVHFDHRIISSCFGWTLNNLNMNIFVICSQVCIYIYIHVYSENRDMGIECVYTNAWLMDTLGYFQSSSRFCDTDKVGRSTGLTAETWAGRRADSPSEYWVNQWSDGGLILF